jgi:ATP-binding cassette subfamily F protein 3
MSKLLLRLNNISYVYPGMKESLFENVTFSIHASERIGILGFNGSGKTTLLDIIANLKKTDTGEINRLCDNVFYMQQEDHASGDMTLFDYLLSSRPDLFSIYSIIREMEQAGISKPVEYSESLNEFKEKYGYEFIQRIEKTIDLLGFSEEAKGRHVNTLSGGEKRLLKLATGFIHDYDLYLLDEPTNYFDDRGMHFLIQGINSVQKTFLIVSHDRWFLDNTVHKILEIEQRTLREYKGDYSTFYHTKQTELKEKLRKKARIETEIKKLKDVERNYKAWGNRKEKMKSARYKRDRDKKSVDKGNIGHKTAKLMKRAVLAKERVQSKIEELEQSKPHIERYYAFRFEKTKIRAGSCLSANSLTKTYQGRTVLSNIFFTVDWGEKVAVVGPNGSGKTTLLKILLNKEVPDRGNVFWDKLTKIGYLAQQWEPEEDNLAVSVLFPEDQHDRARTLIGVLKVMVHGNVFDKKLSELSEGQKRKVKLVQLIVSKPNIVILDEPTTHLDYQTVEFLEKALQDFNGTVILVSHDEFLRERVTTRKISIQKSTRRKYD